MLNPYPNQTPPQTGFGSAIRPEGICVLIVLNTIGFLLGSAPDWQWWWCWGSGVLLLAISLGGGIFRLPTDMPWTDQTLRPWLLSNLLFTGYNFLTSIFYWLDLHGFFFLHFRSEFLADPYAIQLAARAQFLYLLGQTGFLIGLGASIGWSPRAVWEVRFLRPPAETLLWLAAAGFVIATILPFVPGLSQVAVRGKGLMTVAAALSLGIAFHTRDRSLLLALVANSVLALLALSSGWKQEILVLMILNAITFFPRFPRLTLVLGGTAMMLAFVILPPLATEIRKESWWGETGRWDALQKAWARIEAKGWDELSDDSWQFLTGRLSEVGMFTRYIDSVPERRSFYGTSILEQALLTPVPRILWPAKPVTEEMVHRRVVENGVVEEYSVVSAKPQFVVDAYLSLGATGVLVGLFLFGLLVQTAYQFCESYLGGYLIGGILFHGLFSITWTGSCWEFFVNSFVWSLILSALLMMVARQMGVLRPVFRNV